MTAPPAAVLSLATGTLTLHSCRTPLLFSPPLFFGSGSLQRTNICRADAAAAAAAQVVKYTVLGCLCGVSKEVFCCVE
jgi:hypothetical protein